MITETTELVCAGEGSGGGSSGASSPGAGGRRSTSSVGGCGGGFFGYNTAQTWVPAVNLYETQACYVVCVDLAGVEKAKIDVVLEGGLLHFRGCRVEPAEFDPECLGGAAGKCAIQGQRVRVHVMEIDHGAFERTLELPADADRDAVTAKYRAGLLWVEVPKVVGGG